MGSIHLTYQCGNLEKRTIYCSDVGIREGNQLLHLHWLAHGPACSGTVCFVCIQTGEGWNLLKQMSGQLLDQTSARIEMTEVTLATHFVW
jgi:hypothetical protein